MMITRDGKTSTRSPNPKQPPEKRRGSIYSMQWAFSYPTPPLLSHQCVSAYISPFFLQVYIKDDIFYLSRLSSLLLLPADSLVNLKNDLALLEGRKERTKDLLGWWWLTLFSSLLSNPHRGYYTIITLCE